MAGNIEFFVNGIVEGESGRLRVIGRCCEDTIQVGCCFRSVYDYDDGVDADGREVARRVRPCSVELRIARIHAYGHFLDFLSTAMTGTLDLEGTGMELVRPGLVLGGEPVIVNGQNLPSDVKATRVS
jgi:hypothetical protein